MVLDSLIAQEVVFEQLNKDFLNEQVSQVYLFHGPSGVGKLKVAEFFSKKILCESFESPCNICLSCEKFDSAAHLDFLKISLSDDKKKGKIETIRQEILPRVYQKANEGNSKVFIFDGADKMTLASFNSLLKVIEEPPLHTFFIFITSNLYAIPITILSRCRKVRFQPLGREKLKKILSVNYDADLISSEAIEIAENCRGQALSFLKEIAKSPAEVNPIDLMNLTIVKFDHSKPQRDNALSFLISIRSLLRDMLILQLGSEDLLFWNVDIERSLKEIVLDWSQSDLISAFLITEKSIKDLTVLNTNSSLTLESLVHTIRSFLIER